MTEENSINILPEDLIPSLAGGSQASRRYAAQMLGIEWPDHLGPFFLEVMENGAVPVRQAVAETLGRLYGMNRNQFNVPGPEGLSDLPYLSCLLRGIGDPDETTRVNSARSLGHLKGEEQALQALTGALSDPAAKVRAEAARSLGNHRDLPNGAIADRGPGRRGS